MIKEIYLREITDTINLVTIESVDLSNWDDSTIFKAIFEKLFPINTKLFFSFRREENLTNDDLLKKLRFSIPKFFDQNGEYHILYKLDNSRFDSVATLSMEENTLDLFLDLWSYFYSCNIFIPSKNFDFSNFIDFQHKINFIDQSCINLISNKHSLFEVVKGLGGEQILIYFNKEAKLPNFHSIISSTVNKKDIFR